MRRGEQSGPQLVQQLMVRSGLDKQLDQYPGAIQTGLTKYRAASQLENLTDGEFDELIRLVGISYNPRRLKDGVQQWLARTMSDADLRSVLAWLGSPTGERITKLEEDVSTPDGFARSQSTADELMKDAARVELVKKLDRAMKGTESAVNSVHYTTMVLLTAAFAAYPPELRLSAEEINDLAIRTTEPSRPLLERAALRYFLYSYRSLSDDEINLYIAFSESDAGKRYIEAGHAGVNDAMLQASRDLGTRIGEMIMKREPAHK